MSRAVAALAFASAVYAAAAAECKVTVRSPNGEPRRVHPWTMGCHSDTGYAHQARALFAELVYGNAFGPVVDPPNATGRLSGWLGVGGARLEPVEAPPAANGTPLLLPQPGDGAVNRGMAAEGLFLHAGRDYGGYLVLGSGGPVAIEVALQTRDGSVLDAALLRFPGGNWTQVNFTLRPKAATVCDGIDFATAQAAGINCPLNNTYDPKAEMSDRTAHICVRCGGQFVVTLREGSAARVAYASLMPGAWGRFAGLPVHREAADALRALGVRVIRQGGTFTVNENMHWKRQRGVAWRRPSAVDGIWTKAVMSGWGLFEMIDLTNALDITPVITTFYRISPEEFAELVEYCWGNASTKWGAIRIADGHPEPYRALHFELGNEGPNPAFVDQAKAMEQRAVELGLGGRLSYILSNGWGKDWPDPAQTKAGAALGFGNRLVWDIHVNGGGATDLADYFFSNASYDTWAAMNLETNYGDHTLRRMLEEAQDLNRHFGYSNPRFLGRTASFCMERSGYQEGGLNDQGLVFFLPNMTWFQPPGYVHSMISQTWQPIAQDAAATGDCGAVAAAGGVSAQLSEDGETIVLRVVNADQQAREVSLDFGTAAAAASVKWRHISGQDLRGANTPSQPRLIAPSEEMQLQGSSATLPGYSYSVFVVKRAAAAPAALVV